MYYFQQVFLFLPTRIQCIYPFIHFFQNINEKMKFCKWKYYYVVDRLDRSLSAEIKTRQVESLPSKLGEKKPF